MFNVYQHWDPLRVCAVGRSYPPEFYSWIKVPHVRKLFERIAIETEEDYQGIIKKLQEFGVDVIRSELMIPKDLSTPSLFSPPPMCPRDHMVMIGDTLYTAPIEEWSGFYSKIRDDSWPTHSYHISDLPESLQQECVQIHKWGDPYCLTLPEYHNILRYAEKNNTKVKVSPVKWVNGAMVSRLGRDLYFGTDPGAVETPSDLETLKSVIDAEFVNTRNFIVDTRGHGDGSYCPVCPGLIISLQEVKNYQRTFPGWEVIYLAHEGWGRVKPFLELKQQNYGKWWIPGFENDKDVINVVETWLTKWTGYVEETVFDINMLMLDPKNVMVFNYNKLVFDALERYGITPHIVKFRHRYFWDGGIHCVTLDLDRTGQMQNFFPERA